MSAHPPRLGRVAPWFAAGAVAIAGYQLVLGSRSQFFGSFPYRAAAGVGPGDRVTEPSSAARTSSTPGPSTDRAAQPIALTFDDGPNPPHTDALLDLLAQRGVQATFFQVGRNAERHPALTRRVLAEGHVLGNHSYHHEFHRYLTDPSQDRELARGREALAGIVGREPMLYRPPWLCHPPWVLRSIARSGAQVVSGTFAHPLEIVQPPAAWMAASAVRLARPGSILIMHDGREARGGFRGNTVAAAGLLIDELTARGHTFTTVDRLLDVPAYR